MKITTLIENHEDISTPSLKSEHGVSFYIDLGGHVYLSDLGQSGNFAENAEKLGVDLSRVEALAISHYHYDHGGGLARFITENDSAAIYLRRSLEADYLAIDSPDSIRFIGLDRSLLKQHEDRIIYLENNQEIAPGFHLLTDIPGNFPKPHGDERLKMRLEGVTRPDTFEHEMVSVLVEGQALVILTGCAHNGVLNMIAAAKNVFPDKKIKAVIGGFHLSRENDDTVVEVGRKLLDFDIPMVITGHCTGDHAIGILKEVLGGRLQILHTGLVMNL